ncbi:MAG: hypothetical protein GY754_34250 [bacterium]|nr:hypothetical protein [bacterium]
MKLKRLFFFVLFLVFLSILVKVIFLPSKDTMENIDNGRNSATGSQFSAGHEEAHADNNMPGNAIALEKANIINDVILEKTPVCSGEEFMVTVKAENPYGSNGDINFRVGNARGNPVLLKYQRPGKKKIHVFANAGAIHRDHRVLNIDVISCENRPTVEVTNRFSSSTQEEVEFEVVSATGLRGTLSYDWDFGNGKKDRTNSPVTTHNYADREQRSYSSSYIVTVSVSDEQGTTVQGRTSVTFVNVQWLSSRNKSRVIPVTYNRFPIKNGGRYRVRMRMKNIFNEKISFSAVDAVFSPCSPNNKSVTVQYGADEFFSKNNLNPGEAVEDTFVFEKSIFPFPPCSAAFKLRGATGSGIPVQATLYITIPMSAKIARQAVENSKAWVVSDKNSIKKIKKAQIILNKKTITPSDIYTLEKEGKL